MPTQNYEETFQHLLLNCIKASIEKIQKESLPSPKHSELKTITSIDKSQNLCNANLLIPLIQHYKQFDDSQI